MPFWRRWTYRCTDPTWRYSGRPRLPSCASTPRLCRPFSEIQTVLVGAGFVNTAKKGQAVNNQRVWGKHASFIYVDAEAAMAQQPCWGFTAQWGDKVAGEIAEPKMGIRGSQRVRVAESVKEVTSAPALGYYFQNAVA